MKIIRLTIIKLNEVVSGGNLWEMLPYKLIKHILYGSKQKCFCLGKIMGPPEVKKIKEAGVMLGAVNTVGTPATLWVNSTDRITDPLPTITAYLSYLCLVWDSTGIWRASALSDNSVNCYELSANAAVWRTFLEAALCLRVTASQTLYRRFG